MVTARRQADSIRSSSLLRRGFDIINPAIWIGGSLIAWELACRIGPSPDLRPAEAERGAGSYTG